MSETFVIKLTRELVNPEKDGRNKNDWHKQKTIPAGEHFIVSHVIEHAHSEIKGWVMLDSELGRLILANSVRVEPRSLKETMAVAGLRTDRWERATVLQTLFTLGRITAEDFALVKSLDDAKQTEWEAKQKEAF
jgi:hypothetical protein